jgi:hypothetical protein
MRFSSTSWMTRLRRPGLLQAAAVTWTERTSGYVTGTTTLVVARLPAASTASNTTAPAGGRVNDTEKAPSSATSARRPPTRSVAPSSTLPATSAGWSMATASTTGGATMAGGVVSSVKSQSNLALLSRARGTSSDSVWSPSFRSAGGFQRITLPSISGSSTTSPSKLSSDSAASSGDLNVMRTSTAAALSALRALPSSSPTWSTWTRVPL